MEQGIRSVIILWLLLSTVSSLHSQSAGDIDTLSQWRVDSQLANSYGVVYDHFKYFIDGDTVIGATEYYKVYKSGYSYEYEFSSHDTSEYYFYERKYSGVLREGGNRWYTTYYPDEDVLLYDFTMNIGDSLYGGQITVVDIDTVMVDGEPKKRFHLLGAGFGGLGEHIIEDVGATTGLFEPLLFFENTSILYCYAVDYVPLWIHSGYFDCDLSVNIKENVSNGSITCYPNPFTTTTTIEYELIEPSHVQLTIYNAIGEVVYKAEDRIMAVGKHSFTWSGDRLSQGLYYVVLRSEDGVSVMKMVKQ